MRGIVLACLLVTAVAVHAQSVRPAEPTKDQLALSDIEVRRLVPLLKLEPGTVIADVGAGLGAWALRFARWTGPSGHVYATDIDDVALASLRALVTREQLPNVTVLTGAAAVTNLPDACCDAILLRNVFHYVADPDSMIRSLSDSLKSGGRLAIVDFPPRPRTTPPPGVPANRGGFGIPPDVVEREIGAMLRHVTTVPNWAPEGMPPEIPKDIAPSYVAIFEKPK